MLDIPNFFEKPTAKKGKAKLKYKVVVKGVTISKHQKKTPATKAAKKVRGAKVYPIGAYVPRPKAKRSYKTRSRKRTRR